MESYNVNIKCPKCGWHLLATEYHRESFEEEGCAEILCEYPGNDEHILRTCARCEYKFFEKPLGVEEKESDERREESKTTEQDGAGATANRG